MKSILIISAVFPPEPVVSAKLSYEIAETLSEDSLVIVLSPKPTRPFGYKFEKNNMNYKFKKLFVNSYTCPEYNFFGRFRESLSFGIECSKFLKHNNSEISVVYVNSWPLFSQFLIVRTAKKFNLPIIMHVQDLYPESLINKFKKGKGLLNLLLLPIDKYILRNSDKIIAISDKMKTYLKQTRNLENNSIMVLPNWQDEREFLMDKQVYDKCQGSNKFTFMYLGNIGPVAGIDLLIDAFVLSNIDNCRLIIAGSGSKKEELKQKAKEYPDFTIEFWEVKDGEVPKIQKLADVLVLTLTRGAGLSSIPSKLPAYMLSAKPIIACVDKESDTAHTIVNADCGWIVDPDISQLSQLMKRIHLIQKDELEIKGKNGFNYAIANHSRRNNLPVLKKVIDEFTGKDRKIK